LDNKWAQEINFWFSSIKEGYVIEFVVEYSDSFKEAKREFVEGPQRRFLEEVWLCIKILFMEKGLMRMDLDYIIG
jgi:hypothetical protein